MKHLKAIITWIIIAIIITLIAIYSHFANRTIFNSTYVNGNTAGNLYNSGLFCEKNGTIYFSNPSDKNYLYSMTSDGANVTKLYDDNASYINADDNYVYYVRNNVNDDTQFSFLRINTNSLCRYDIKKKTVTILDSAPSIYSTLVGNYVYYIHYDDETASTLYRVKIDGTEKELVDKNPYQTCSTSGQYIFYNGLENDHNIYQMDTSTGSTNPIYTGNCWMPIVEGSNLFFMDAESNYALATLPLKATEPTILVSDRIETMNVYGKYIYFQKNNGEDDTAICRINTDGTGYTVLKEGNFCNINITSRYVYFSEFDKEDVIYRTPTGGDGIIEIFQP